MCSGEIQRPLRIPAAFAVLACLMVLSACGGDARPKVVLWRGFASDSDDPCAGTYANANENTAQSDVNGLSELRSWSVGSHFLVTLSAVGEGHFGAGSGKAPFSYSDSVALEGEKFESLDPLIWKVEPEPVTSQYKVTALAPGKGRLQGTGSNADATTVTLTVADAKKLFVDSADWKTRMENLTIAANQSAEVRLRVAGAAGELLCVSDDAVTTSAIGLTLKSAVVNHSFELIAGAGGNGEIQAKLGTKTISLPVHIVKPGEATGFTATVVDTSRTSATIATKVLVGGNLVRGALWRIDNKATAETELTLDENGPTAMDVSQDNVIVWAKELSVDSSGLVTYGKNGWLEVTIPGTTLPPQTLKWTFAAE